MLNMKHIYVFIILLFSYLIIYERLDIKCIIAMLYKRDFLKNNVRNHELSSFVILNIL